MKISLCWNVSFDSLSIYNSNQPWNNFGSRKIFFFGRSNIQTNFRDFRKCCPNCKCPRKNNSLIFIQMKNWFLTRNSYFFVLQVVQTIDNTFFICKNKSLQKNLKSHYSRKLVRHMLLFFIHAFFGPAYTLNV